MTGLAALQARGLKLACLSNKPLEFAVPLLKTCEALGTQPARTAGCPVLLVTYGYNHGAPIQAVDADGFTDSLVFF
jgi:phosphoglycolate phosphatase